MTQAGSSSVVELGFGVQIICLQMAALESHGLCEATDRLFTSLTSAAGVRGIPRSDRSPGGHLVQHGPDEGARLRPQSGFPDEHAGRGKGRARNRGQAGAVLAAKGSVRRGLGNSVWTLVAVRSWTPAGSWEKEIQATGSSL